MCRSKVSTNNNSCLFNHFLQRNIWGHNRNEHAWKHAATGYLLGLLQKCGRPSQSLGEQGMISSVSFPFSRVLTSVIIAMLLLPALAEESNMHGLQSQKGKEQHMFILLMKHQEGEREQTYLANH
jgi:hypothetical protein